MPDASIEIRAKLRKDVTEVKILIDHPMVSGLCADRKTGGPLQPHFIQEIKCLYNGQTLLSGVWGPAISKNPTLFFRFKGGRIGDTITVNWVDNLGNRDSYDAKIF